MLIGKDSRGNLYYDMFIDNSRKRFVHDKKPIVTYPETNQGPQWVKGQLLATKDDIHSSDLEVNIFVKPLINNGCGFNPFTQDSWDEDKHPRGDDGKFGSGNGKKKENNNTIEISGNELGEYKDIKELRQKAFRYYKEHLQGTSVDNPKLNKILFSRTGVDKFISSYVSENKLTMVVALESIIKTGKFEGEFELTKNRKDGIVKFYRISKEVNIGNSSHKTSLLIGEDRNGKRFYNLNINADTYSKDEAPKGFSPNMVRPIGANRQLLATKDDIHSSDLEVNIFVKPLINNGCGFNPFTQDSWDEDKHPRGDDGRFGSGGKKKESDNNAIEISGNELGEYKDIKELRQKAFQY